MNVGVACIFAVSKDGFLGSRPALPNLQWVPVESALSNFMPNEFDSEIPKEFASKLIQNYSLAHG